MMLACNKKEKVPEVFLTKENQKANTTVLLQAISVLDSNNVWISGHEGTFCKTENGGAQWNCDQVNDFDTLQFRDIHALNLEEIILMSAGEGALSSIFKSFDRGENWERVYQMDHPEGFLDCLNFWDEQRGLAYGDSFDGYPFILTTTDGGQSWVRVSKEHLPEALDDEGGFAASGTCVEVQKGGLAWIGTGAGEFPRILISEDYGKTWSYAKVPIVEGEAAGITSVSFISQKLGTAVGGDLAKNDEYLENTAFTTDGGKTWEKGNQPITKGSFYGSYSFKTEYDTLTFACGPNGIDYSTSLLKNWTNLDTASYWAVSFDGYNTGWATGPNGSIMKIRVSYK
ncbi:MAG: hypothetical protein AAF363_01275 [Bacteroidota bacterium]